MNVKITFSVLNKLLGATLILGFAVNVGALQINRTSNSILLIDTAASVTADKFDYPPGSTVQISGTGFQAGETVQLQVLNITDCSDTGPEYDPWTINADANGNFKTTWYVTANEANMTLQLMAMGLTSDLIAQTTFTDSSETWTGGPSTAWTTAANWNSGSRPQPEPPCQYAKDEP
jgi:hypothetical protein